MSHDLTTPHRHGVSPLRQARLDRGWSQREAAAHIRAHCPGPNSTGCRVGAERLDHFETGLRHPSPTHTRILTDLYQRTAAELGLTVRLDPSDQQRTSRQEPPAAPPKAATPKHAQTTNPPADPDPDGSEG